jgi:hypothetical protein
MRMVWSDEVSTTARVSVHSTEWLWSQYRNAVASGSGSNSQQSIFKLRSSVSKVDPTLPRYGTDSAATRSRVGKVSAVVLTSSGPIEFSFEPMPVSGQSSNYTKFGKWERWAARSACSASVSPVRVPRRRITLALCRAIARSTRQLVIPLAAIQLMTQASS